MKYFSCGHFVSAWGIFTVLMKKGHGNALHLHGTSQSQDPSANITSLNKSLVRVLEISCEPPLPSLQSTPQLSLLRDVKWVAWSLDCEIAHILIHTPIHTQIHIKSFLLWKPCTQYNIVRVEPKDTCLSGILRKVFRLEPRTFPCGIASRFYLYTTTWPLAISC